MNANAQPDNFNGLVSSMYRTGETDQGMDDARRARRRFDMSQAVKPLMAYGSNIFANIWRVIQRIVRKIASAFGVKTDIGDAPPLSAEQALANFEGSDASPAQEEAVDAAVKEATRDLDAFVHEILANKPNVDRLVAPGGEAYLAMRLAELGGASLDLAEELRVQEGLLHEEASKVALRVGISTEAVLDLLKDLKGGDAENARDFSPEAIALAAKVRQTNMNLCKVKLQFCDFAIAGLQAADALQNDSMAELTRAKVSQFADSSMAEHIFKISSTKVDETVAQDTDKRASVDVNCAKKDTVETVLTQAPENQIETPVAHVAKLPARMKWAGRSAGVVPDEEPPSDEEQRAPRQRG
jgi:hypothetical protein